MSDTTNDVLIIGKGPAGVSASLYTARAGLSTVIIGKDDGSLGKSDKVENYYGFPEPIGGRELVDNGVRQAERLGVQIVGDEVTDIEYDGNFVAKTDKGSYKGKALLFATGAARKSPNIEGIAQLEGKGVSYCAVCDAFFYRQLPVAVMGSGSYAVSEAKELLAVASSVTILTNGQEPSVAIPPEIHVDTRKVAKLAGDESLEQVVFEDGDALVVKGLFVALGVAGSGDFARKLGAKIQDGKIVVDENMATNLPGLYAAGDCIGGVLQIAVAVGEGAKAGLRMIEHIRKNTKE